MEATARECQRLTEREANRRERPEEEKPAEKGRSTEATERPRLLLDQDSCAKRKASTGSVFRISI